MAQLIDNGRLTTPFNPVVVELARSSTGLLVAGSGPGYTVFTDFGVTASGTNFTTNTAGGVGDLRFACTVFRAYVYMKTYVPNAATATLTLEASTTNAFTVRNILDTKIIPIASATAVPTTLLMYGMSPVMSGYQFIRIGTLLGSGQSGTFDILLEGA